MEHEEVTILGIHLNEVFTPDLEDRLPDDLDTDFTYELEEDPEDEVDLATFGLVTTTLGIIF